MTERIFNELLRAQWEQEKFLCVGLDPDVEKVPVSVQGNGVGERLFNFNRAIIDATKDIVCAYKPNSAFYEGSGEGRFAALHETIRYIHEVAPTVPVILDAKRADIGNTNHGYVESAFTYLRADAITVHPYLGGEALQPFLDHAGKGVFVLCRTSNPDSAEFQDLMIDGPSSGLGASRPLYMIVAQHVADTWNKNGNCGLVVGATYPEEMARVRAIAKEMPILIPGIGTQNGDLAKTVQAGKSANGSGMIINVGRAILFASGGTNFADAARKAAQGFHREIQAALLQ